jgi:hypothetical protein
LNPSYGDRYVAGATGAGATGTGGANVGVAVVPIASASTAIVTPIPQRGRSIIAFVSKINTNTDGGINHTNHFNVNMNLNNNLHHYHYHRQKQHLLRHHLPKVPKVPKESSPLGSPPMLLNVGGKDEINNNSNKNNESAANHISASSSFVTADAVPSNSSINITSNINNRIGSITPTKKRKISTMNTINERSSSSSSSSNQINTNRSLLLMPIAKKHKKKSAPTTMIKKKQQQQPKQKSKTIKHGHKGKKFSWKAYPGT